MLGLLPHLPNEAKIIEKTDTFGRYLVFVIPLFVNPRPKPKSVFILIFLGNRTISFTLLKSLKASINLHPCIACRVPNETNFIEECDALGR